MADFMAESIVLTVGVLVVVCIILTMLPHDCRLHRKSPWHEREEGKEHRYCFDCGAWESRSTRSHGR